MKPSAVNIDEDGFNLIRNFNWHPLRLLKILSFLIFTIDDMRLTNWLGQFYAGTLNIWILFKFESLGIKSNQSVVSKTASFNLSQSFPCDTMLLWADPGPLMSPGVWCGHHVWSGAELRWDPAWPGVTGLRCGDCNQHQISAEQPSARPPATGYTLDTLDRNNWM